MSRVSLIPARPFARPVTTLMNTCIWRNVAALAPLWEPTICGVPQIHPPLARPLVRSLK